MNEKKGSFATLKGFKDLKKERARQKFDKFEEKLNEIKELFANLELMFNQGEEDRHKLVMSCEDISRKILILKSGIKNLNASEKSQELEALYSSADEIREKVSKYYDSCL